MQKKSFAPIGIGGVPESLGNIEPAATTEDHEVSSNRLQRDIGRKSPPDLGPHPTSWQALADWISADDGVPISRQRVQYLTEKMLDRILKQLIEDPYIREWAEENGVDLSSGDLATIRGRNNGYSHIRH